MLSRVWSLTGRKIKHSIILKQKYLLTLTAILAADLILAIEPIPPSYTVLEKTKNALIRMEVARTPEGGSYIQYEILNSKKLVLKRFPISDTQFDAHAVDGAIHGEKISAEKCISSLKELDTELKKMKFKKVKIHPDECRRNRKNALS